MRLFLKEIKETPQELTFSESSTKDGTWVRAAVASADETPTSAQRPIRYDVSVHQVDGVVVMNGHIATQLKLLCSRCAKPIDFDVDNDFSSLFCRDPELAGVAHLSQEGPPMRRGQNHGYARNHGDSSVSEKEDLDITYLTEDFVDLAQVLGEQVQLQVPAQPLCRVDCQGLCPQCGTDLNLGRCACAKIKKDNPFSVLGGLKLKETRRPD